MTKKPESHEPPPRLEGRLEEAPFPALLLFLSERKATGRLVLNREEVTKVVFIVEGRPVNVDSTLRDETLGRYLVKKGKITEEDFEKSVELMIQKNIQQGAALVKMGLLSPRELYHEVKAQTREKLLSCFAWTSGTFAFYPGVDFVEDTYRFEMQVPQLLHEGINRFFPKGAAEAWLAKAEPGPISPLPGFSEKLKEFELSPQEAAFVMEIDGEADLKALKKKQDSYPFAVKFLYFLLLTGMVGPQGKREERLRAFTDEDLPLPPIEEFVIPASAETAPEVVEQEIEAVEEESPLPPEPETREEEEEEKPGALEPVPGTAAPLGEEETTLEQKPRPEPGISEEPPRFEEEEIFAADEFGTAVGEETAEEAPLQGEEPVEEEIEIPAKPKAPPRDESEILEFYMDLKRKDFFTLLEIPQDAGDQEVSAAYRKLRAFWDKDNFSQPLSPEPAAKLEEIHTQLIRAYEALRTEEDRKLYKERLAGRKPEKPRGLEAEQYLQQGLKHVRRREWPEAQKMFEKAVEANPEEPEYLGYLGWTVYSNPELDKEERTKKAKELIEKALSRNPHMDSAHVFLGKILKEEGKTEEALKEFKTALECNPKCREAERELKRHEQGEW